MYPKCLSQFSCNKRSADQSPIGLTHLQAHRCTCDEQLSISCIIDKLQRITYWTLFLLWFQIWASSFQIWVFSFHGHPHSKYGHHNIIIGFLINMQVQGQHPHQWAPFQTSGDNVLRPDIADLSDHCPVISLQTLEVRLCQWQSLAGMEHCPPHTRAVHTAMCYEREVAWREDW